MPLSKWNPRDVVAVLGNEHDPIGRMQIFFEDLNLEVQSALASERDLEKDLINANFKHLETSTRLREAAEILTIAVGIIRKWHGMGMPEKMEKEAWKIYLHNSPEMEPIRKFSESARAKLAELNKV